MRTPFLLALPLLIVACQPADAPVSGGRAASAAAVTGADLVGAYRVASVDGASIDQPEGIIATITGNRIEVQSGCVRFAYDYLLDGAALSTTGAPVASCRRGLTPAEQAVQQGLAAATQVTRTSANGLQFAGSGRSVVLFRQ